MRRKSRKPFFIVLFAMLALSILVALFLIRQVQVIYKNLDRIIARQLTAQLDRQVRIGRVVAEQPGLLIAENVVIEQKPQAPQPLARIHRAEIRYNLGQVLRGVPVIRTISQVTLISPEIRLSRGARGELNIQDLFRPRPGPPRPGFQGVVIIRNGDLVFSDSFPQRGRGAPLVNRIASLSGVLDARSLPRVPFELRGRGASNRVDQIEVVGFYSTRTGGLDISIQARNLFAPYWWSYFTDLRTVRPLNGRANMGLRISRTARRRPLDYAANFLIRNVSATIPQARVPATNLNGRAALVGRNVTVRLTGNLVQMPVRIEGSVFDITGPQLALTVQSSRVTDAGLRRAFPDYAAMPVRLTAPTQASLRFMGPADSPVVDVQASTPRAVLSEFQFTNLRVQARYADGLVQITRAVGNAAGGAVTGTGLVDLTTSPVTFAFSGTGSSISVSRLPLPSGLQLTGRGDVRFSVVRRGESLSVDAETLLADGQLFDINYNRLTASIRVQNRRVQIAQASASLPRGSLRASGEVTLDGELDLRLVGSGIDVATILRPLGVQQITGTAFFTGSLTGTVQSPVFTGQVQAFGGRFQGLAFDFLQGQLTATSQELNFSNVVVRRFPAEYVIAGAITLERGQVGPVRIGIQAQRVSVEELLRSLGVDARIAGTVEGQLQIEGRTGALGISGSFRLGQGNILGIDVTSASGDFRVADNVVTLTSVTGATDGGAFTVNGNIGPANRLDLELAASNISLSMVEKYVHPYLIVSGRAELTAHITGTSTNPTVTAEIQAAPLTINNQGFDSLAADVSYADNRAAVTSLTLARDESRYVLTNGAVNPETRTFDVRAEISGAQLSTLLELVVNSPYLGTPHGQNLARWISRIPRPVSGSYNSTISVSGPFSAPAGQVTFRAGAVQVGTVDLDVVVADARLTGDAVVFNELSAARGETELRLNQGSISYAGMLNLDLNVFNMQLAALNAFLPSRQPLSGQVDLLSILIQGTTEDPQIIGTVDISNAVIAGLRFDRISSTPITIADNQAAFDQIVLRRDIHGVIISGGDDQPAVIPVDIADLRIARDRPVRLHAELDQETLAILPAFIPSIPGAEGAITASVDVTGTLEQPVLSGEFTVANGTLRLPRILTPLQNIQARILLSGNNILVEKLTGSMGEGTFSVTGTADLGAAPEVTLNLAVNATGMEINETNLTGYGEAFRGRVSTSNLTITGPLRTPLVAGAGNEPARVQIFDAVFTVPTVAPGEAGPVRMFPVNPRFSAEFDINSNVTLAAPLFRVTATGKASLTGTLSSPQLVGHLTTNRGVVYYPSAVLRIVEGEADFVVMPPLPARITLNTCLRTTISGIRIAMQVTGPLSNLQFDLTSTPPLPEQRLLALLLRQEQIEAILRGQDISSVLGAETLRILSAQLEPRILLPFELAIQEALGLEEFALELGFFGPPTLVVSRQLFGEFYVTYLRSFVGPGGIQERYRFTLSYRFRPNLAVAWSSNDQGIQRITVEGTWRF